MEFKKIKKAVEQINAEKQREQLAKIRSIAASVGSSWAGERYQLKNGDEWTFEKLTDNQRNKTIKEQKEIQKNKTIKKYQKELNKKIKFIEEVEQAEPIERLEIFIEWTSGSAYGWQAKGTARAYTQNNFEYIEGTRTGGWGYDKRSTASADVLNQIKPLSVLICQKLEKMPIKAIKEYLQNKKDGRNFIGYGFNFYGGAVGSFSGGVGFECHRENLSKLGLKCTAAHEGKQEDFYKFEASKKGGRK